MLDKVFYINLDRRSDRDYHMSCQIKDANLSGLTERVSAIDGAKINFDNKKLLSDYVTDKGLYDTLNINQKLFTKLTKGGMGCALSHLKVWQKIIKQNIPYSLILEDDVVLDKDLVQKLDILRPFTPKKFDMLFLGYHPNTAKYINKLYSVYGKAKNVRGLFGYVVSLQGAKKLVKAFPITHQIDTEIWKMPVDAYILNPNYKLITSPTSEESSRFGTDIQTREYFGEYLDRYITNSNKFKYFIFACLVVFIFIYSKKMKYI